MISQAQKKQMKYMLRDPIDLSIISEKTLDYAYSLGYT